MDPADRRAIPEAGAAPEAGVSYLGDAAWARLLAARTAAELAGAWLAIQCGSLAGAACGVVALAGEDGRVAPAAWWPDARATSQGLVATAERAVTEGRGFARPAGAGGRAHVAYPFVVDGAVRGVAAVELAGASADQLPRAVRQLQWGSAWIEALVRREELEGTRTLAERVSSSLDLVVAALGAGRVEAACTAVATTLAAQAGCARASVGLRRRRGVRLAAVSGRADFDRRMRLSQRIEAAMDEAIDQGRPVGLPDAPGAAVAREHEALARESGHASVLTLPLEAGGAAIGALTLEWAAAEVPAPERERLVAAAALLGPVLDARRREDRGFAARIGDAVAEVLGRLLGPAHLPTKLAAAAALGLLLFLVFAKGEYRVSAESVLEAGVERALAAPFDGYVAEAPARPGDRVEEGALLARLDDQDLLLERARRQRERLQHEKEYQSALAEGDRLGGELARAQMGQAEAQIDLLDEQLSRTRLLAPFAGIVISGDLSQALGAPVARGDVLFEIAPLEEYRVVLRVDEHDVADVEVGQPGLLRLHSLPGHEFDFTVARTTPVASAAEGRNSFRVEGRLAAPAPTLRPGMEGVAKVSVDRRRYAWIWTHDLFDWLRLKLWAWVP